tara:strand:+ start:770 stop:976 length:207 start_codon:yes stop_codon:yes gene_type:complete
MCVIAKNSSEIDRCFFPSADVSKSYRTAIIKTAEKYGVNVTGEDITAQKHKYAPPINFYFTCNSHSLV